MICSCEDSASVSAAVAALESVHIDANLLKSICQIRDKQTLASFTRHKLEHLVTSNLRLASKAKQLDAHR
jgi:hypothetical protein